MVANPQARFPTPHEYLEAERASDVKSEYINGQVRMMAGASRNHNLIVANLLRDLGNDLFDRPCEVYPSDMRVAIPNANSYFYPDVVVVCGDPKISNYRDNLENPTVLIEVLSPSTAATDRGTKFFIYRQIPSLQDYLIVSQDEPLVEHYSRKGEDTWLLTTVRDRDAQLLLDSIGCTLTLDRVYAKVKLTDT